jgi:hypothetical protein
MGRDFQLSISDRKRQKQQSIGSKGSRLDVNLRREGPMDRTFIRNLEQLRSLFIGQ